eukprot:scaffold1_cov402-Prasinococcus_capsulatus_cf.AAC.26
MPRHHKCEDSCGLPLSLASLSGACALSRAELGPEGARAWGAPPTGGGRANRAPIFAPEAGRRVDRNHRRTPTRMRMLPPQ